MTEIKVLHMEIHSPKFSSFALSDDRNKGAPMFLMSPDNATYAYALLFNGIKTVYPLLTPRNTCPQVLPRLERISEENVSVLIPSFKRLGVFQRKMYLC
jgi:hypothetical protein